VTRKEAVALIEAVEKPLIVATDTALTSRRDEHLKLYRAAREKLLAALMGK
jgi:hypothetical protein